MAQSNLSVPYFHNEEAAYKFVEARIWPNGPICPHCGGVERISKMGGKSTRIGAYKCYDCRKPFTVKIGTIFESSHIHMRHWLQAIFLIAASKKGISSNQLHRTLGITLKSAWFMSHRIREAMKDSSGWGFLGGKGAIVEAGETFIGKVVGKKVQAGVGHKMKVMSLVQRGGKVRSVTIPDLKAKTMQEFLKGNVEPNTHLMTDEAWQYIQAGKGFKKHSSVNHSVKEYARGPVTTNTIEGFFSIFKRGMRGVYQHCAHQHLDRYLSEFDFRYNNRVALGVNDQKRAENLLRSVVGKRLTYETTTH